MFFQKFLDEMTCYLLANKLEFNTW